MDLVGVWGPAEGERSLTQFRRRVDKRESESTTSLSCHLVVSVKTAYIDGFATPFLPRTTLDDAMRQGTGGTQWGDGLANHALNEGFPQYGSVYEAKTRASANPRDMSCEAQDTM